MQAFPSGPGAAALARAAASARAAADVRIEWDQGTRRFACAGVYGRARKLSDGALALVYSRGGDVCLRRSIDGGESWQAEMVVAHTSGYSNTNAELIELADGRLVYGWNGRPTAGGPYRIATRISEDRGRSWAMSGSPIRGEGISARAAGSPPSSNPFRGICNCISRMKPRIPEAMPRARPCSPCSPWKAGRLPRPPPITPS